MLFLYDDLFLEHKTGNHPENSGRLVSITRRVKDSDINDQLEYLPITPAKDEDILRIHTKEYIARAKKTIEDGTGYFDCMDSVVSEKSLEAAYLAAGSGVLAADQIVSGKHKTAFCCVRPPGHHAEANESMGFCIFNNIAITARYLQAKHEIKKVVIFDWDVHHGNGTEHSFYDDDSVLYISTHQYPHYPGTGAREDIGSGKGVGYNLNIPMNAGTGDQEYLEVMGKEVLPAIKKFAPDFILISAGFDANHDDQLSSIRLSPEIFGTLTEQILSVSDSAEGRIISFLEGGYDYDSLSKSVVNHIKKLI